MTNLTFSSASPTITSSSIRCCSRRISGRSTRHPLEKLPPKSMHPLSQLICRHPPILDLFQRRVTNIAMQKNAMATEGTSAPVTRPNHQRKIAVIAVQCHRKPARAQRTDSHGDATNRTKPVNLKKVCGDDVDVDGDDDDMLSAGPSCHPQPY